MSSRKAPPPSSSSPLPDQGTDPTNNLSTPAKKESGRHQDENEPSPTSVATNLFGTEDDNNGSFENGAQGDHRRSVRGEIPVHHNDEEEDEEEDQGVIAIGIPKPPPQLRVAAAAAAAAAPRSTAEATSLAVSQAVAESMAAQEHDAKKKKGFSETVATAGSVVPRRSSLRQSHTLHPPAATDAADGAKKPAPPSSFASYAANVDLESELWNLKMSAQPSNVTVRRSSLSGAANGNQQPAPSPKPPPPPSQAPTAATMIRQKQGGPAQPALATARAPPSRQAVGHGNHGATTPPADSLNRHVSTSSGPTLAPPAAPTDPMLMSKKMPPGAGGMTVQVGRLPPTTSSLSLQQPTGVAASMAEHERRVQAKLAAASPSAVAPASNSSSRWDNGDNNHHHHQNHDEDADTTMAMMEGQRYWSSQIPATPTLARPAVFAEEETGILEAEEGIARPGAFAVQGLDRDEDDYDDGSEYYTEGDEDEDLDEDGGLEDEEQGGGSLEQVSSSHHSFSLMGSHHTTAASVRMSTVSHDGTVFENETTLAPSLNVAEAVVTTSDGEAIIQAELYDAGELVEDAAVVQDEEEDEYETNPKLRRRRRLLQVAVVCFSIVGVICVIISGITGFQNGSSSSKATPVITGWTLVGDQAFPPNPDEAALVQYASAVAVSRDGTRVVATAPGTDQDSNFNVGETLALALGEQEQINGTVAANWEIVQTWPGVDSSSDGVSANPISSMAMNANATLVAVGYPLLYDRQGRVQILDPQGGEGAVLVPGLVSNTASTTEQDSQNNTVPEEPVVSGFGYAVDLSPNGQILAVGAPLYEKEPNALTGLVRLYRQREHATNTTILGEVVSSATHVWEPLGNDLLGMFDDEMFGWSVALCQENRIAVGAPFYDTDRGLVRVYDFDVDTGVWTQVGSDLVGTNSLQRFGESVSLSDDGTILAVGARGSGFDVGTVHIYRRRNDSQEWIPDAQIFSGKAAGDGFGAAVTLTGDGQFLAIGAPLDNEFGLESGIIQVWQYNNNAEWTQQGSNVGGPSGSNMGASVDMTVVTTNDNQKILRLVGGAPGADFDQSVTKAGSFFVYDRELTTN
eukprot:CAMPEP_0172465868 /NCGR_PEP_ID=MMETSP1065-20121228/54653_1 /TAXON_ID=265537 /ORGANISM="Amphiprora paludosa, Strain CCMP125" /LENGTH=1082 /DNA_ID=CAMNT_0013222521 /DNA_START=236 /DNA_END=3484 /DNA_ORIENTATION=+